MPRRWTGCAERNAATRQQLQAWPGFETTRERILQVLDSRDRIPAIVRRGDCVYNFWQDADQARGLWRRTTLAEYRKSEPAWELLLDVDALGRSEGENWVWAGAVCLGPDYTRCLVKLSRGGADAQVVREFDSTTRQFVAGGFSLPEAKSDVVWLDARHGLRRHRFRPRFPHRFGLSAPRQALAARNAAGPRRDGVRGAAKRRRCQCACGPHTWLSAHLAAALA